MTKEGFIKLVENAQKYTDELDRWYDFGINLDELPISDLSWNFFNTAMSDVFTKDGLEWIDWWLYSIPGKKTAYNPDGSIIPTDTLEDLWNIVKDYQK